MATSFVHTGSSRTSSAKFFESCEMAFSLIRSGHEAEAKELFPLESYLVKKYLYINLEVFKKQMEHKLSM